MESSVHTQQSLASAAVESGQLQKKQSRSGQIRGRRSVEHNKPREGDGSEQKTAVDREGAPVVVKRGRGRPRKVCIT